MTDLFREVDESLREDRLKTALRRYGPIALALVLTLILGIVGWNLWQGRQIQQDQARTAELVSAVALAESDPEAAADALAALFEGSGGQATLAGLHEAALRAEAGDGETAVLIYRRIAADPAVDPLWADLARLLAVMHELDTGEPAALRAELEPLMAEGAAWRHSARELEAVLSLRLGDEAAAREGFTRLAEDPEAPAGIRERAGELRDLLGGAPADTGEAF